MSSSLPPSESPSPIRRHRQNIKDSHHSKSSKPSSSILSSPSPFTSRHSTKLKQNQNRNQEINPFLCLDSPGGYNETLEWEEYDSDEEIDLGYITARDSRNRLRLLKDEAEEQCLTISEWEEMEGEETVLLAEVEQEPEPPSEYLNLEPPSLPNNLPSIASPSTTTPQENSQSMELDVDLQQNYMADIFEEENDIEVDSDM